MSGFISALIKQRKDAKKAEPNTNARLKEIIEILKKYDFSSLQMQKEIGKEFCIC